jgi:hypothetical protein
MRRVVTVGKDFSAAEIGFAKALDAHMPHQWTRHEGAFARAALSPTSGVRAKSADQLRKLHAAIQQTAVSRAMLEAAADPPADAPKRSAKGKGKGKTELCPSCGEPVLGHNASRCAQIQSNMNAVGCCLCVFV